MATAIKTLKDAFASLSPAEIDTSSAVLAAIDRNRMKVLTNTGGATLEQVMESFGRHSELMRPQDPKAVLDGLVKKKALKSSASGGDWQYFPPF